MNNLQKEFLDLIVYQIYPRSFYDSNGDGIGDLRGITQKLDHLQELGINAIWLCPCYKSPNYDNGYDVADYREIAADFGTMDDWKQLREESKKRGIKLIMDLVFNHTSSFHPWFLSAKTDEHSPYHDYYIWAKTPPNSWQSVFGGSAWEYNLATKEYYLHSFAVEQPDLNWENPKVRQECQAVVDFWVDMGVDGFRCDVLDFISKDFSNHKMHNGPRLHEFIRELFNRPKTKGIFTIGECQTSKKDICDICGPTRGELSTVFQFDHILHGRKHKFRPKPFSLNELRKILVEWQYFTQENDLIYTLFTDNHDNPYFLSRFSLVCTHRYELATLIAAMVFLLKGIPFLYQTQEYGAINPFYPRIEAFNDVESLQFYNMETRTRAHEDVLKELNLGSRDNTRRPFAWTGNRMEKFGFSTAKPWLPLHSLGEQINLQTDKTAKNSVFKFYQKILTLRRENECLRYGDFTDLTGGADGCFVYKRAYKEQEFFVICNFEKEKELTLPFDKNQAVPVLFNYADATPLTQAFRPFEVAIYKKA